MAHLVWADDHVRAARHYAAELTEGEVAGATRSLVDYILADTADTDPVSWILSLIERVELDDASRGRLCVRFNFDLDNALTGVTEVNTRLRLLRATEKRMRALAAQDPANADARQERPVSIASRNECWHHEPAVEIRGFVR